jgi:hypothetical protein
MIEGDRRNPHQGCGFKCKKAIKRKDMKEGSETVLQIMITIEIEHASLNFLFLDYSQLFLYSLLNFEMGSLRKHCKDHSNEFVSYSK